MYRERKRPLRNKRGQKERMVNERERLAIDGWRYDLNTQCNYFKSEKLLLIKAIDIYGEKNWNQIAKYVGSKNSDQCSMFFLKNSN